jgi:CheY-like chemotaxis protein
MIELSALPKKILLVEDSRTFGELFKTALAPIYDVDWVLTASEAMKRIARAEHHFAVIDVGLGDGSGKLCDDALGLIDHIRAHWLDTPNAFMMVTSSSPSEIESIAREAKNRIFYKTATVLDEFKPTFESHFNSFELTGYNWKLEIKSTLPNNTTVRKDDGTVIEGQALLVCIEDLLRQLFAGVDKINVSPLGASGFSGAQLLKAGQPLRSGRPRNYVVKIAHKSAIRRELKSTKSFVEPFSIDCAPEISGMVESRLDDVAAIKMRLFTDGQTLGDFIAASQNEDATALCQKILSRAYSALRECWYSAQSLEFDGMPDSYFRTPDVNRLVDKFRGCYRTLVSLDRLKLNPKITIKAGKNRGLLLHNPVYHLPPKFVVPGFYPTCIVHGDFHPGNILYSSKSENIAVIDFAYTKSEMSLYSDYAHFEAFLLLDTLRSSSKILSQEQRILLVKELFSRPDFEVDLKKAMSDLPNRSSAYVSMLEHNRTELKNLVKAQLDQHAPIGTAARKTIFGHYAAILLFYFTLRWYWMSNKREFDEDDLVFQLVACSELISSMIGKP